MEQYEDIKSELQQELHDLQQNVEQHSSSAASTGKCGNVR